MPLPSTIVETILIILMPATAGSARPETREQQVTFGSLHGPCHHQALDRRAGGAGAETCLRAGGLLSIFATGVALNLGNPKMPLFYVALLPNVVGTSLASAHLGILIAVILAVEIVVIGGHVVLAGRARSLLRTPRIVRRVNRAAGGVMIGAGVAVVATCRCSLRRWAISCVVPRPDR